MNRRDFIFRAWPIALLPFVKFKAETDQARCIIACNGTTKVATITPVDAMFDARYEMLPYLDDEMEEN